MASIIHTITNGLHCDNIPHFKSDVITGAVSWLASSVTKVGFLGGAGFSLVALTTSSVAYKLFRNIGINNDSLNLALSGTVGGAAAYGAFLAIGYPVTVPVAIALTVIALATKLLSTSFKIQCLNHGIEHSQVHWSSSTKIY